MPDPTTHSLLIREVTILAKSFGQLQRNCWELSRVLLRALEEYDKMTLNKGESGGDSDRPLPESPPGDPFTADLWSSHD